MKPRWRNILPNTFTSSRDSFSFLSSIYIYIERERDYNITWALKAKATSFSPTSGQCRLCLTEKTLMVLEPQCSTLNNRDEFYNHCLHKDKLLLGAVK